MLRQLQQHGYVRYEDLPLETIDGTRIAVEFVSNVYQAGDHNVIQCNVRDITERKSANDRIAEQADFLDKARDAIVVRDLEGKIQYWSKGAERMYGWTRDEVLGAYIGGLVYQNPKEFERLNEMTIRLGEWQGDVQHLTQDRRVITTEARWTLIRDDESCPKSVLSIDSDVTERKKIEVQFMRAQRMESIGTLAGGIAHDLNNILTPILMSIDLLKAVPESPRTLAILDTIEASAKRGSAIVRQVLSFARGLEGERVEIQPKHQLKEMETLIKETFPKDIQLQVSVPNDAWTILGDPTQVHQVLLNLCLNGRDAMPNGGDLVLSVENCVLDQQYAAMHGKVKAGRYVKVSVLDSGTGMPPNLLEKIFEPFFTTKELHKGTGLGLSTVMAIVKGHEGILNVYSEPGKGSAFHVYLPASDGPGESETECPGFDHLPRGSGETILVIDDEASVITITSETLQTFGYHVLTATDGAHGVAVYAQHATEIALVITDMMMPVMDGPATIQALRRINPGIKIIAASGLHPDSRAAKATGALVNYFLMKPYTARSLLSTVHAILHGKLEVPGGG
jgi:PAS domain S-box-containing protein